MVRCFAQMINELISNKTLNFHKESQHQPSVKSLDMLRQPNDPEHMLRQPNDPEQKKCPK